METKRCLAWKICRTKSNAVEENGNTEYIEESL